jgi:hypothetical protein
MNLTVFDQNASVFNANGGSGENYISEHGCSSINFAVFEIHDP